MSTLMPIRCCSDTASIERSTLSTTRPEATSTRPAAGRSMRSLSRTRRISALGSSVAGAGVRRVDGVDAPPPADLADRDLVGRAPAVEEVGLHQDARPRRQVAEVLRVGHPRDLRQRLDRAGGGALRRTVDLGRRRSVTRRRRIFRRGGRTRAGCRTGSRTRGGARGLRIRPGQRSSPPWCPGSRDRRPAASTSSRPPRSPPPRQRRAPPPSSQPRIACLKARSVAVGDCPHLGGTDENGRAQLSECRHRGIHEEDTCAEWSCR